MLFVFSALAYLLFEKKWSTVSIKGLGVTFVSGLLFSLPVLIWNYQHDFISFRFQLDHGLGQTKWDPAWSLSYPVGQALLLFPVIVWYALKAKLEPRLKYFYYFSWFPLAFFFISSFRGNVEANWPIVAYPAVFALAVFSSVKAKWIWITNAFWILLFTVFLSEYTFSWMSNPPRRFAEGHQYDAIIPKVPQYQPLYACTYQMASVLWYRSGLPTMKLFKMSRRDLFDHLQSGPPQEQKFYLVRDIEVDFPVWLTEKNFTITKIEDIPTAYELYEVIKK